MTYPIIAEIAAMMKFIAVKYIVQGKRQSLSMPIGNRKFSHQEV